MPHLSSSSLAKLSTCHPDLQRLVKELIHYVDVTVLCGHRAEEDQTKAFNEKRSKVQYPNSKHNIYPSLAVDIAPYPIDWQDRRRFYYMGGFVTALAQQLEIAIRWGGDWNGNYEIKDNDFEDLPHLELVL